MTSCSEADSALTWLIESQGVSAIKSELSEGKKETYVMRQRLKHFQDGKWTIFDGFVDLGEEEDRGAERTLHLKMA